MKTNLFLLVLTVISIISCSTESKNVTQTQSSFAIHRGLNISHWLSQSETRGEEREQYMQAGDFKHIANMGFDHVRIPIDEEQMWDEDGNRHEEAFKLLHNAINWSFENNLRVIVDLHILRSHYFNDTDIRLWKDTLAQQQFWGFWEELSSELINYPTEKLAYELMNEAVAEDAEDWNKLIAKGIEVVRKNEPNRKIVVGSNKWQQVNTFNELKVPKGDSNIILSFHYYEPFLFTHHQAPWSPILKKYVGEVHYPGYTVDTLEYANLTSEVVNRLKQNNEFYNKEVLEEQILKAVKVAKEYNLPLYCGEFGCLPTTPLETRVNLYSDLLEVFDKYNIAWSHWNYKNDFPVVDAETLEPIEEIVSVLTK